MGLTDYYQRDNRRVGSRPSLFSIAMYIVTMRNNIAWSIYDDVLLLPVT
jgi:hypothetical protein